MYIGLSQTSFTFLAHGCYLRSGANIFGCVYVTGFEKTRPPRTITNKFRNTDFNYLKYCNSGREADACMKFATIL